eukprot:gene1494-1883_t
MSTLVFDHNNLFDLLNYNLYNLHHQNNNNNKSTPTTKTNENKCKSEQQNPQQQPKSCKEQKSQQQQQQQKEEYTFVYTPSIDVSETSESFIIDLELPGVSKNDISINYNDSKLIVEGKKQKSIRLFNHNNNKKEETFLEDKPTIEEINDDEFDGQSTTSSTSSSSKSSVTSQQQQQQQQHQHQTSESEKKAKEILNERRFGKLRRVIDLSSHINTIDIHSIKAQYNNGVLEITIPKKDAPKPIKITIN